VYGLRAGRTLSIVFPYGRRGQAGAIIDSTREKHRIPIKPNPSRDGDGKQRVLEDKTAGLPKDDAFGMLGFFIGIRRKYFIT
jgi:hypothetical protein